jgi:hypothetical protein
MPRRIAFHCLRALLALAVCSQLHMPTSHGHIIRLDAGLLERAACGRHGAARHTLKTPMPPLPLPTPACMRALGTHLADSAKDLRVPRRLLWPRASVCEECTKAVQSIGAVASTRTVRPLAADFMHWHADARQLPPSSCDCSTQAFAACLWLFNSIEGALFNVQMLSFTGAGHAPLCPKHKRGTRPTRKALGT